MRAAQRVRAVQHDDRDSAPCGRLHRVEHRADVRPGPRADVLQIHHEHVEVAQRAVRRRDRPVGVQRLDDEAAPLVDPARELLAILRAANPVFGREESHELDARGARLGRAQPLDVGFALLVDARLIREQTHALAADQMDAVGEQHADSRTHDAEPAPKPAPASRMRRSPRATASAAGRHHVGSSASPVVWHFSIVWWIRLAIWRSVSQNDVAWRGIRHVRSNRASRERRRAFIPRPMRP